MNEPVSLAQLNIVGLSALTPLGEEPEQIYRAVESGISAYEASNHRNFLGEAMTLAQIPDEAIEPLEAPPVKLTQRQRRCLQIALAPLKQLFEQVPWSKPVPLVLAVPEKWPEFRTPLDDKFLNALCEYSEIPFNLEQSYALPYGRAAGLKAIALANDLLNSGQFEQVVVGGVDSLIDEKVLAYLDKRQRVLGQGIKDGFCPGEAACFALLQAKSTNSPMRLLQMADAEEVGHIFNEEPYTGEALASASSSAMAGLKPATVGRLSGTLNGESFYAKEWGVLQIRNSEYFQETYTVHHPADCLGDLGAASALVNLMLLHEGYRLKEFTGASLLTASSDLSMRAAMLVTGN